MKKPPKPSADFPLFPHAAGYWAKKIRGRFHYFAPWDQPDEALDSYRRYADDLHSGRITEIPKNRTEKGSVSEKGRSGKPRPKKPYPDFPLFPHAAGQWAKKIKGKVRYFGPWANPQGSLDKYLAQKDDLFAGRTPRAVTEDGCTVRELVNRFLASKEQLVESGELSQRSYDDYKKECEKVLAVFGRHRMVEDLTPEDFENLRAELAKKLGPVALGNAINRVRILFKYAYDQYLVDKPVRYGQTFKRPSRAVLRKERGKRGPRMFEAKQIRDMLDAASKAMKAMTLLGINCGFGNNDCAMLPRRALDLKNGWVNFPRPKTGIERRCPLWSETVEAIREAVAHAPEPEDEAVAGLAFLTKHGKSWSDGASRNAVTGECRKLLKRLGIDRPGLGFYALRRTFHTIGEQRRDLVAVQSIMGHAPASNDISSLYREEMTADRLRGVTDHIRSWLFGG